jgi:hypothetical protein
MTSRRFPPPWVRYQAHPTSTLRAAIPIKARYVVASVYPLHPPFCRTVPAVTRQATTGRGELDSRNQTRRFPHSRPARFSGSAADNARRKRFLFSLSLYRMAVGKLPVRSCLIDGEAIVCDEGIVSKRLGSIYRRGRSPHWLKVKNPKAPAITREAEEDWGK